MLKRIAAALLSVGALLGSALCVNAAEADTNNAANMAIKLGDADNNGAVNAVDASIILSNYARYSTSTDKPSDYELITQDVNDDGLVNAVDASIVLSYYAYRSIGGTFTLPEYLKAPNEAPTAPVTTTTEPTTYEYTLENITQSAEVFNYFAEQMNNELFRGRNVLTKNFNGEDYYYTGEIESKVALLVLNENASYKDGVLREVFTGYNDASIKDGVIYFYRAPRIEMACDGDVNFSEYALDKNIGNYMNALKAARKNGESTGNYSNMDKILEDILYNSQYQYASDNIASLYYTIGTGHFCPESKYDGDCDDFIDDGNFCGLQELAENKIKELIK